MSVSLKVLTGLAVLLAWQSPVVASDTSPIIVHREQVNTLQPDGWGAAQSTAGRFSAEFPCIFNDYTSTSPEQPALKLHWLQCQRADGVRFAVMRPQGADAKLARASFDSLAKDPRYSSTTFKEMPAYSYATMADERCARVMLVWTGTEAVMAIAERIEGTANCLQVLMDGNRFAQSLEVVR